MYNLTESCCGISSAEQVRLKKIAAANEELTSELLEAANRNCPETNKFVLFSHERVQHYDVLVPFDADERRISPTPVRSYVTHKAKVFTYNYINCTTEVKQTQSNDEWTQSILEYNSYIQSDAARNSSVLSHHEDDVIDAYDYSMKFENVMFQFIGDVGDYVRTVDFSSSTLKVLDDLVDEILPRHNKIWVFEIEVPLTTISRSRGPVDSKAAQRIKEAEKKARKIPPPSIPFSAGQNAMVSRTFLSYRGLESAVARGKQLGFTSDTDYQAMQAQLQWCKDNQITEFSVELVMFFSQKYLRMHMDEDEIRKAMDSGKVYMIMAGMRQSPHANSGGKVIIPISLVRKSLTANMEIPTYDSHAVELPGHVSDESVYMTMEKNSVNMLVHFCDPADHISEDMVLVGSRVVDRSARIDSRTPGSDVEMEDEALCNATHAIDVGTFERITSEYWPAHIIEEIVAGCGTCRYSGNEVARSSEQFKIRGETVIVQTPAIHPLLNPKLSTLLREQGMTTSFAMHVKIMSSDMNTLRIANQNVYLEYRAQTPAGVPYVHADRSINCTEQMACFMVPQRGSYNYPIYPSDLLCDAYGIKRRKLEDPNWNIAAASVMFGMDFLIHVHSKDDPNQEDLDGQHPSSIGPSPTYPGLKCITYALHPVQTISFSLFKMPKTMNESIFDFDLHFAYIDENGDEDIVERRTVQGGGKTGYEKQKLDWKWSVHTTLDYYDFKLGKFEGEAPDSFIISIGPDRIPLVQIQFVLHE